MYGTEGSKGQKNKNIKLKFKKMTKSKNVFLLAAMAVSAVCVSSCGDDEPEFVNKVLFIPNNVIDVKVENGTAYDSQIDSVKAVFMGNNPQEYFFIASGKYADGGFTITLPTTLDNQYLMQIPEQDGVKVSDISAQICIVNTFVAYKDGRYVGRITSYTRIDEHFSLFAAFFYADKNVSMINGSEKAFLQTGWSKGYGYSTGEEDLQVPETPTPDATLSKVKWYFGADENYDISDDAFDGKIQATVENAFVQRRLRLR
ncbi:hypothetical protein AGMMS4957_07060 [Bacteroidia bacterium]|nr:hypothetical protein AGMMS4957_07060 [Bacteroidia bacterium]